MKSVSIISVFILLLATTVGWCQTKVIAHKSHSGSMKTFSIESEGNFGLPVFTLDSLIKISDTTVIEVWDKGRIDRDTIANHHIFKDPNLSLDKLKKMYPGVKLVGFEDLKKRNRNIKKEESFIVPD